jgi:16S rRNA (cytosine967-C5)-methyltransferase
VFADPSTQPAAYVADAFSLPDSLAGRWAGRMTAADLFTCCFYAADVPRTTLRVNRLRSSTVEVTAMLEEQGCQVQRASILQSLSIESGRRIEKLPGFSLGYWTVQDESASAAALLLKPRPGERILDLCAAPGGKTTHLAELSDDAAHITACDVSDDRLARVDQNATRLGLQSITLHRVDRNGDNVPPGPFDAILVDVPCSNTGVLCRRPEARWRFNETDLAELIQLQTRLLLSACERVAPGGRIVYSTCSLEPEENRGVVDSALRAFPKFQIITEQTHRAGDPADGAYQVLLVRPEQNL